MKGEAAEEYRTFPGGYLWADGEHPADCRVSGALSDLRAMNRLCSVHVFLFQEETVMAGISACVEQGKTVLSYLRKCCQNISSGEKKEETDPLLPKDHVFMGW